DSLLLADANKVKKIRMVRLMIGFHCLGIMQCRIRGFGPVLECLLFLPAQQQSQSQPQPFRPGFTLSIATLVTEARDVIAAPDVTVASLLISLTSSPIQARTLLFETPNST